MTLTEKVAYLKGLAEGMDLQPEASKESKLIAAMMDILEDMALTISDIEDDVDELSDALDVISDDLEDVENIVFDEDFEDDDEEEDDEDFFEVRCPSCNNELIIDEDILAMGEITCPNCGEKLQFDLGPDCDTCEGCLKLDKEKEDEDEEDD